MAQLSERTIATAKATNSPRTISDGGTGLHLLVHPTGTKTYIWRMRVGQSFRKITIGRVELIKLTDARDIAITYTSAVKAGRDPFLERQLERQRQRLTVTELWERYEKEVVANQKSAREKLRIFKADVKPMLGTSFIDVVTRKDLRAVVKAKVSTNAGRLVYMLLSAMFRWAEDEELIADSPMFRKKWELPRPRTHTLTDDDCRWLLLACEELRHRTTAVGRWAVAVIVLLRLGQRDSDVTLLVDKELNLDEGLLKLPPERHKGDREHVLPLPTRVVAVLRSVHRPKASERVFQSLGKKEENLNIIRAKAEELAGHEIEHWCLHDLRRTVDTWLRDAWDEERDIDVADSMTIEAVLGHSLKGVARHYNQSKLLRKKGRALAFWNAHLDSLLTEEVAALAA